LLFCANLMSSNTNIVLKPQSLNAEFEYSSGYYRIGLSGVYPFIQFLSVDGLGKGQVGYNPVLFDFNNGKKYELKIRSVNEVELYNVESNKIEWRFSFDQKRFLIKSFTPAYSSANGLKLSFGKRLNHATLLGMMKEENISMLPALLHLPDMGTFAIRCSDSKVNIGYFADRRAENSYISIFLPAVMDSEKSLEYSFEVVNVFQPFPGVENTMFDAYRRNYLNLFQINPKVMGFANNSGSDACSFTLFMSSMLALNTPFLVDSLSSLDLLRMSLDRYMNGLLSYGMNGYRGHHYPFNSLDAFPSLVIASCNYVKGSKDMQWATNHYEKIKTWMDQQMIRDRDGDGLVEYEFSGNTGSWTLDDKNFVRPANWWDTIGFGHIDGFSNTLTYDALRLFTELCQSLGKQEEVSNYSHKAELLKANYFKTLYNPKTGVLAGWKSADGELHDYYFLVVNSMAIYYDLVPANYHQQIMKRLFLKMEQMGLKDFKMGLPGNIIPVKKLDYVSINNNKRFGASDMEDGSDGFQIYENGGLSLNWTYYTLKALEIAGLKDEYQRVSTDLLHAINNGVFQGYVSKDKTNDWRKWNGESWGYEGYLCDGYLALMAIFEKNQTK
jgi:hypothetical protein